MQKPDPALAAMHDFVRDLCAFAAVGLFVVAVAVWAYYLREPPPQVPV